MVRAEEKIEVFSLIIWDHGKIAISSREVPVWRIAAQRVGRSLHNQAKVFPMGAIVFRPRPTTRGAVSPGLLGQTGCGSLWYQP